MGQCVTINVGNKREIAAAKDDEKTPKSRRKRKKNNDSEDEDEEDGEEGFCGCIEDITGCLPCI